MRILFIDEDVRVFEALQRVFFDIDPSWQTAFASSTQLAFAELTRHPYDVVVSEGRISGVDGALLLARVRELYPRIIRIVLSGHSDEGLALKMVRVAHQFLAKPCPAELLYQIIARGAQLNLLLDDHKLQSMIGQVETLPSAPHVQQQLKRLLDREDSTVAAIAAVLKQDPAMTGKLLQVASSAFFNTTASLTDVETAITRLGPRTLRTLTSSSSLFEPAQRSGGTPSTSVAALQRHSLAIAQTASRMAKLPEDASVAYLTGLLCDVGQLVLAGSAPERLYVTEAEAQQAGVPAHIAERSTWGTTHAEIGAYLLGIWGLPFQVVDAVAKHHAPERQAGDHVGLPQLVWLAACIVDGQEPAREFLHRFGAEELYATSRRDFEALH